MVLTQKETAALKDLQTQEHYKSLGQASNGTIPSVDCNDSQGHIHFWRL